MENGRVRADHKYFFENFRISILFLNKSNLQKKLIIMCLIVIENYQIKKSIFFQKTIEFFNNEDIFFFICSDTKMYDEIIVSQKICNKCILG